MGAALYVHRNLTQDTTVNNDIKETLYLGPKYDISMDDIKKLAEEYDAEVTETTSEAVANLIADRNIVSLFQGRSENGPRALGNRSILYDPRDPDGNDFVNNVKHREYFRPFAGSVLQDDVHDWFDLRGMEESPSMMYAVNVKAGKETQIPCIIHVDGTCRIQSVTQETNPHYYELIKHFKDITQIPMVFNTSFNLGGDPLVETLEDAFETLKRSKIEYLYLPETGALVKIANE